MSETTVADVLAEGTKVKMTDASGYPGQDGIYKGKADDGCHLIDVLDSDGNIESHDSHAHQDDFVVLPPTTFDRYTLVRYKFEPGSTAYGTNAWGLVVDHKDDEVVVMRVGEKTMLKLGTQTWPTEKVEAAPDDERPVYKTDSGEMRLGDRVIFQRPHAGMRGTIIGQSGDGPAYILLDSGQENVGEVQPYWSNPDHKDPGSMFSPSLVRFAKVGEEVGAGKGGAMLHVGDRFYYDGASSPWKHSTGVILARAGAGSNSVKVRMDGLKLDGTKAGQAETYSGPDADCNLQRADLVPLEPEDTEVKPLQAGDRVVRTGEDVSFPVGTFATIEGPSNLGAGMFRVKLDDGSEGTWTEGQFQRFGTPVEGYAYQDGKALKHGDRVVYDPGHPKSGRTATVVMGYESGGIKYARVIPDDKTEVTPGEKWTTWNLQNISRLQDEDKEKIADEVPQPTPAVERLQELFGRIDALKEGVEEAITQIEAELSEAENAIGDEVRVTFDEDSIRSACSISTSNSELLSLISYDGDGTLSIDDGQVDEHARDTMGVDTSAIEWDVEGTPSLDDLHSAFAKGQERLQGLLAELDAVRETALALVAEVPEAETKIVTPETETFKGTIHNARFGTVLPEDAEVGPTVRFDVVADHSEGGSDANTKATRRVRLVGKQIGTFMATVGVSDVKNLEGREAILQEDPFGGWFPTAVSEV